MILRSSYTNGVKHVAEPFPNVIIIPNTYVGYADEYQATHDVVLTPVTEDRNVTVSDVEYKNAEWLERYGQGLVSGWDLLAKDENLLVTKAEESYKPTSGMVTASERALRWKKEGKATGAGTPVGWGRATDIAAGRSMSFDVVQRMYSFFSRHEVDKKGKDFDNLSNPSNGRIMWDAWGGNAGFGWSRNIVERHKRMEKHLLGQHDQASHGRKGHIKSGYNNWYGHLADLRLAGQDLTKQGNKSQMVIVEAAGFNGKPEMVELSELEPDKIIYRGLSNEDAKTDFIESEVQFGGMGVIGNGTYFSDRAKTATDYSGKVEFDDKRIITAQWKPDANVLKFENIDEATKWFAEEQKTFREGVGQHYQSATDDFVSIGSQIYGYFGSAMNFSNLAIMQGYDGYEVDVSRGTVKEKYTIVLNRGKLKVAK